MMDAPAAAIAGLLAGLGLIVAIGAQNAFVLRQGLRREHVGLVVAICMTADASLIALGTLGIGAIVEAASWVPVALRYGGAAYLTWFAIGSFRSAFGKHQLEKDDSLSAGSVVRTTLALTFLNPHVYLDTVVMLGTLANQQGDLKWIFAVGAMGASVLWFTTLGFGAHLLSGPLGKPSTWRVVDVVIGLVMLGLAVMLAFG